MHLVDARKAQVDTRDALTPPEIVGDVFGHLLGERVRVGRKSRVLFVNGQVLDLEWDEAIVEPQVIDRAGTRDPSDTFLRRCQIWD